MTSLLLATLMLLSSCLPHYTEPKTDPLANRYTEEEIQAFVDDLEIGQHVRLLLMDGSRKHGKLTCIYTDMLCFRRVRIPWDEIAMIEYHEWGEWGWGDMILAGAVVLVIFGVIVLRASLDEFYLGS